MSAWLVCCLLALDPNRRLHPRKRTAPLRPLVLVCCSLIHHHPHGHHHLHLLHERRHEVHLRISFILGGFMRMFWNGLTLRRTHGKSTASNHLRHHRLASPSSSWPSLWQFWFLIFLLCRASGSYCNFKLNEEATHFFHYRSVAYA